MGGRGGGGGGIDPHLNFGPIQNVPHGCPKWANTKVTSRMSKMEGGSRPLLYSVQKKDAFFSDGFPYHYPVYNDFMHRSCEAFHNP